MKIGLFAINMQPTVDPAALSEIATLAESLGYESLWAGEHVVLPDAPGSQSPFDPELELVDPLASLSYLAAITRTIRLATGIVILPLRNPVVMAKQLASLDVLSGGRLIFGYGNGYLRGEFDATGVPYSDRIARGVEYLEAMRALWYLEKPRYHGRYVEFSDVKAYPRPVQRDIPVVVGGASAAAHRIASTHGSGWYAWSLSPAELADVLKRKEFGALEITVTPPQDIAVGAREVEAYARAGANRIVLYPPSGLTLAELRAFVRAHAPAVIGVEEAGQ